MDGCLKDNQEKHWKVSNIQEAFDCILSSDHLKFHQQQSWESINFKIGLFFNVTYLSVTLENNSENPLKLFDFCVANIARNYITDIKVSTYARLNHNHGKFEVNVALPKNGIYGLKNQHLVSNIKTFPKALGFCFYAYIIKCITSSLYDLFSSKYFKNDEKVSDLFNVKLKNFLINTIEKCEDTFTAFRIEFSTSEANSISNVKFKVFEKDKLLY